MDEEIPVVDIPALDPRVLDLQDLITELHVIQQNQLWIFAVLIILLGMYIISSFWKGWGSTK